MSRTDHIELQHKLISEIIDPKHRGLSLIGEKMVERASEKMYGRRK